MTLFSQRYRWNNINVCIKREHFSRKVSDGTVLFSQIRNLLIYLDCPWKPASESVWSLKFSHTHMMCISSYVIHRDEGLLKNQSESIKKSDNLESWYYQFDRGEFVLQHELISFLPTFDFGEKNCQKAFIYVFFFFKWIYI